MPQKTDRLQSGPALGKDETGEEHGETEPGKYAPKSAGAARAPEQRGAPLRWSHDWFRAWMRRLAERIAFGLLERFGDRADLDEGNAPGC